MLGVTNMRPNRTGAVMESWQGLRLRAMEDLPPPETWPEPLLAPRS